ncbi:8582_t:CDS:2, partial [Cetraspora pellucida]
MHDSEPRMVSLLGHGQEKKDIVRTNYTIASSIFQIQEFFGYVEYYLVYEFEGKQYMLAYVRWIRKVFEDNL